MALTFNTKVQNAYRLDQQQHGMRTANIEMTVGATTDYQVAVAGIEGFDIQGNSTKFGFRKVYCVIYASIRTSAGAAKSFVTVWQPVNSVTPTTTTGRLRFFKTLGAAPTEIVQGDLATGDIVHMVVIGV